MNVAQDDLALVLRANFPENKNIFVEVVEFIGLVDGFYDVWLCRSRTPIRTTIGLMDSAYFPDANLRRISGPSIKIDADIEQPINTKETEISS